MSQEQEREANFAGLCKQLYPRLEVADSIIVEALRKHGDEGLAMEEVANWQPWESSADLSSAVDPKPAPKPAPKPSAPAADVDSIERQKREFEKFEKANQERLENERKEKEKEEAARREATKREEEARLLELAIAEEKAKQLAKERIAREEEQRRAREERALLARMERERAKQEELLKAKLKEEEEKKLKELQDKIDREKERVRIEREKEEKERLEKEEKERRQKEEEARIEKEVRERVEREVYERLKKQEEKEAKEKREKEEEEARERAEREAMEKADQEAREKRKREKEELEAKEKAEKEAKEKAEQEAKEKAEQEAREKAEQEAKEKAEQEAKQKEEEEAKAKAIEDAKDKGKEDQGKEVGDIMKELQDLKGMNVDFVGENAPPRVSIYVGKESDLSHVDYQRVKEVFIKKEITEKQIRILDIATDKEIEQFLKSSLKQDPLVFPLVCVDGQPIGTPADVYKMDDAKIENILSSTPEAPLFHTGSDDDGSEVHLGALNQVLYAGEYLGSLLMMPVNVLTWPFKSDTNEKKQETDVEFDVIHTNWYWRSQWRILRFSDTSVKRLGPRQRDVRAVHAYDTISLIRVTDSQNIVFHYNNDNSPDYVHASEKHIKEMLRIVKTKKPDLMIEKIEKGEKEEKAEE